MGINVGVSLTFLFYNCSSVQTLGNVNLCLMKSITVREQDAILASMLIRPAPVRPLRGARFVGGPDADRVPRVYIKTMHDRVLKLEQQDAMIKRWLPFKVFVLESDHSPFFSTPSLLFGFLLEAAASVECI